jgi:hypothetical protein
MLFFGKYQREWLQIWKQNTFGLESVQDLNLRLGIQTKRQICPLIFDFSLMDNFGQI